MKKALIRAVRLYIPATRDDRLVCTPNGHRLKNMVISRKVWTAAHSVSLNYYVINFRHCQPAEIDIFRTSAN